MVSFKQNKPNNKNNLYHGSLLATPNRKCTVAKLNGASYILKSIDSSLVTSKKAF